MIAEKLTEPMTMVELQKLREYYSVIEKAQEDLCECWVYDNTKLTKRLVAVDKHLLILQSEIGEIIAAQERKLITPR